VKNTLHRFGALMAIIACISLFGCVANKEDNVSPQASAEKLIEPPPQLPPDPQQ